MNKSDCDIRKRNAGLINIEAILIVWYGMFSYFRFFKFTQYSAVVLLIVIALIPIVYFFRRCVIPKNATCLLWLCFSILYSVQTLLVDNFTGGMAWVVQRFLVFITIVFLIMNIRNMLNGVKAFLAASLIHVFATTLEFIVPSFIHGITDLLLSADSRDVALELYQYDYHCGIAQQASYDACYIAVAFSILFASVMVKKVKNNLANTILLLISIVAMLLTGKRGLVLAIIIAAAVTFIISLNTSGKLKIRYISMVIVAILFVNYIFNETEIATNIIRRMQNEDIFSGRVALWELAFLGIKQHPILGNGTGAYSTVSSVSAHNSLLQLWYENGLIGLSLIILIFINCIIMCLKKIKIADTNFKKEILLMSLCYQIFFIIGCMSDSIFHHYILLITYLFFSILPYSIVVEKPVIDKKN